MSYQTRPIASRAAEQFASLLAVLTGIAVIVPVISIALTAMQPAADLWPHLLAYVLPRAALDTMLLLLGVGAIAAALGVGAAWIISSFDFPGRSYLIWLLPLPLAIPTYIGAYVYVDIFEPLGVAHNVLSAWLPPQQALTLLPSMRSLPGAIVIIGLVLYPYVYLSARAMFQTQSAEFAEAARLLGARRWQEFCRVSLPMARPALAVGLALVLLETLNDIGASEYLGVRTMTVSIFTTWLNQGSLAGAAQISCLMLFVVAALVLLERYGRRQRAFTAAAESPRIAERKRLSGAAGWLACASCVIPPLFGFILPFAYLLRESIERSLIGGIDAGLAEAMGNSVVLALTATVIVLLLGLTANVANRWRDSTATLASIGASQAGYAVPGLILALGLLAPLVAFDNAINAAARGLGAAAPGLLLAGSSAAVVIAYAIRFMAVATGLTQAGFERIPRDYDDSAKVAGASEWTCVRAIYLPLLRPALWGAAILVFVDCLKELPATLLLRPLNVETLSTSIYQFASRGSFEQGSLAALMIVAASIVPVIWLTRFADVPNGPA
ncbi:iron ABC transporter permease [Bradyrhizobium sp. LHD-71]|uniref:ABC transporter permease n=1 Tax=Bradyrhizobium sp. LHD-71 TaxID=3072141 RepID=UPI00280D2ECF|nr:iron ABC transporter permease [Bradyrhizobium sp. LHD-71]MDQ8726934.1 iron ABC transporter permease [Bradyrhizobium sp. LHD-71]